MTKIFIDSNIWIRPIVDTTPQAKYSAQLIKAIDDGSYLPTTSTIVLLEIHYVLKSIYQVSAAKVNEILLAITKTKNLKLIEQTNFASAIKLHQKTNLKLPDCLIATQLPKNCTLVSYDQEFTKIPDLPLATPEQLVT